MAKVKIFFNDLKEEKQREIFGIVKEEVFEDFKMEAENEDEIDEYHNSKQHEEDTANEINCNNIGVDFII